MATRLRCLLNCWKLMKWKGILAADAVVVCLCVLNKTKRKEKMRTKCRERDHSIDKSKRTSKHWQKGGKYQLKINRRMGTRTSPSQLMGLLIDSYTIYICMGKRCVERKCCALFLSLFLLSVCLWANAVCRLRASMNASNGRCFNVWQLSY